MSVPEEIYELIERFDRNLDTYRSGRYNEAQVRQEFINPFFHALGWDVYNKQGYAEAYKDLIHEDAIKIGSATKAPDYCFRIGGTRKFFLEAKKPAVNIREEINPAYQLRRYAWSAKLPLSILTDFEELAVYDCRIKPVKTDKPSKARTLYFTYNKYIERWDEIASIFSRESVLKGSFDKYVESSRVKRGTAEVDTAFLEEIERWREVLARNIALRNPGLTKRELNFAVQRTIDRIVFLRICEDRGIEQYGRLMALRNGSQVYRRLCQMFQDADDRYNSGLFHFKKEKDRVSPPDDLTLDLAIDDKPLKDIFTNSYYPDSPYEFSVLPADILGQVYERFLGKVIRLTPGHRAIVEEKPEVKKAGGVYYTPTYIVDYIVKQTVGKLVEGKKPGPRGAVSKLKILDPACGSGSFLIGAYQYLLDWHRDQYITDDPKKWAKGRNPALYQAPGGEWKLTTAEKKRILLNNIYGVDIDTQAVEVTKLSLLLKVLEDENAETIGKQLALFQERALPDLGSNIKCGNSLIGPDFYEGRQMDMFDEEEMYRVNVFDWETEFKEVMQDGGFDAVIGNPPYVFGRDWKALNIGEDVKAYLGNTYKSSPYQLDMFSIFMEQAYHLAKISGSIGLIVPNVWLTNTYSSSTRSFVLAHAKDLTILTPPPDVFPGITVDTIVYTLQKAFRPGEFFQIKSMHGSVVVDVITHDTQEYLNGQRPISTVLDRLSSNLVYRLKESYPELQEFAKITRGVHPYRIGGYGQTAFGSGPQTKRDIEEKPYHSEFRREGYRGFIYGRDLHRFKLPEPTEFIKYGHWLAEPRNPVFFEDERIYSRKILGKRLIVTIETSDSVADQQVYITKLLGDAFRPLYLAGILGSELMAFFIRSFYDEVNDAFPQIKIGQLRLLPIRTIDFSDAADTARHNRMVELVEQMLDLNKQLAEAKVPQAKTVLQRRIETTDRQIDRLVYELYELTEEEIKIVEGR